MLSRVKRFFNTIRTQPRQKTVKNTFARLHFDMLETREVPATASGIVSGTAFVDTNADGIFNASDVGVPGASITLTGRTTQNVTINVTAVTDANGGFRFDNVLPGNYTVQTAPIGTLLSGSATIGVISTPAGVIINAAENVTQNLGVAGKIAPAGISLLEFLNTSPSFGSTLGTPGSGTALANYRPNNAPIVSSTPLTDLTINSSVSTALDLAGKFTDADYTNSQVTFHITANGQQLDIPITLFDAQNPQTVANFFNYITSNKYDNSIFHRLASNFVLQGGGVTLNGAGNNFSLIDTGNNTVPNEFARSNTQGTLAMALSGGNINSATDQFFFNLVDNSGTLDTQKFTVFGQVANASAFAALQQLATTPIKNESATAVAAAFPTVTFGGANNSTTDGVPMNNYTGTAFPSDTTSANYLVINDVSVDTRDEFLTYNFAVNVTSGPSNLVVATRNNEQLTLSYPTGQTGTATVTVTATDRFGASVTKAFNVNVTNGSPVASDGTLAASSVTPTNGTLVATDPNAGDTLTYSIVSQPSLGNVLLTDATLGQFTFNPQGAFSSLTSGQSTQVTFTFRATDSFGIASAVKTVTVTVTAP